MGTLNVIYIRAAGQEARIKSKFPSAYSETGSDFFAVEQSPEIPFDCPSTLLSSLSREFDSDALWIAFQSTSDVFVYSHWRSGQLERSLSFGMGEQGIWDAVEGNAEPWEAEAFFDQDSLNLLIEDMEDEDERQQAQRIFEQRILEVGNWLPMVDARESARAIAEHYKLPGWH